MSIDASQLEGLLARVEAATGADEALDADIHEAIVGDKFFYSPSLTRPAYIVEPYTERVDAAIDLVKRVLPDADKKRYSGVVWFGSAPAARILYRTLDNDAEGGWVHGALNPHEVHGKTPALALIAALLKSLRQQGADHG
jgi:hypothetical protein